MFSLKSKKGQTMVETALILPIVIMLLMGIFDFGFMFNQDLVILNAAREGARTAALGGLDTEVNSQVNSIASSLDISKLSITISPLQNARHKGDEVSVTVKYNYSFITPAISSVIGHPVTLTAKTAMRVE